VPKNSANSFLTSGIGMHDLLCPGEAPGNPLSWGFVDPESLAARPVRAADAATATTTYRQLTATSHTPAMTPMRVLGRDELHSGRWPSVDASRRTARTGDARIAVPEDVECDPEVLALLTGRMTATLRFRVLAAVLFCFCLALPVLLLTLAAWSPDDTSRTAQVVWAIVLFLGGIAIAVPVGRSGTVVTADGIVKTSGFAVTRIPWECINWFEGRVGGHAGLWVVQWGPDKVRIPSRWHYMTLQQAADAAERANAIFGMKPRPRGTADADPVLAGPPDSLALERPDPAAIHQGEVQRLLSGRVLLSGGFWWLALCVSPLLVVLPTVLLVLGVTSDPLQDTSYRAQVGWAVFLYACVPVLFLAFAFVGSKADEHGIAIRKLWSTRRLDWEDVQAFLLSVPVGVVVLTTAGGRVTVPVRFCWRMRHAQQDAAFLNRTLRRGIPLAWCTRCRRQFEVTGLTATPTCSYHPSRAVRLGDLREGEDSHSFWLFPCCQKVVLAAFGPEDEELVPATAPGCITGAHVEPRF